MSEEGQSQGPATDRENNPVVDPTQNVLDLVHAEARRQDDLREAERRLREANTKHVREIVEINAKHARDLREAESKRIDANREGDSKALIRAQEVATEQAQILARQVSESADTLRKQVAETAVTAATQLVTALDPIRADIDALRAYRAEQSGAKTAIVETKGDSQTRQSNVAMWMGIAVALLIGLMGLVGVAINVAINLSR